MDSLLSDPASLTPEIRAKAVDDLILKCKDILKENQKNRCCKYAIEFLSSDETKNLSNEGK